MSLKKMQVIKWNAPHNSIEFFVAEYMISEDIRSHENLEKWFLYWCDIVLGEEEAVTVSQKKFRLNAVENLHKAFLAIRSCC
ncbi:MAG: hypothetical protein N4A68_07520 [Maledivibacter sp.]|jgi:hypothetical protein|nr:hypothetical protein [Maledivibacter sp.]